MSVSDAIRAEHDRRFSDAGQCYWAAYQAGEVADRKTILRGLFVFFESLDPGVSQGHGLSGADIETARHRFHALLDLLERAGWKDDADVWRDWAGRLGLDAGEPLEVGALQTFVRRGSQEAAWRLAADGDRTPAVLELANTLKADLIGEHSFRSAYLLHLLKDLPVH